ncbi:SH3 domain-containing C40 family peptidase [Lachnospiraceae bacterium 29-84]
MYTAIITAPKTFLYETAQAKTVSDELLSGWIVGIQQSCGAYVKATTHYGYTGWLRSSALRRISPKEHICWNVNFQNQLLPTNAANTSIYPDYLYNASAAAICRNIVDVHKEPRMQAKIICPLYMGSAILLCGRPEDGWQKIKLANGRSGYIPSSAVLAPREAPCTPQELRDTIIRYAMSFLGAQYRWGGKTWEGIDCSGLTFMSYYMCGIIIYRDAAIVEGYPIHAIPLSQIQPADLIYFPGHIALYLGDGKYIHSTGNLASNGCVVNSLNPNDPSYRADLAESLQAAGSAFC